MTKRDSLLEDKVTIVMTRHDSLLEDKGQSDNVGGKT